MKKFLGIMIAGMLLVVLAACGNGTSSNGEKVLRVGATGQSFPNSFKEGDKLVGYDVEVLEAVAKNLGYKVEWTLTDFSGLMGQMEAGKLDTIANNVAVTDERKKYTTLRINTQSLAHRLLSGQTIIKLILWMI